jgi:hypothetical protein
MHKTFILTAILLAVATSAGSQSDESIRFPSRSSDLSPDSYWTVSEFSEGCCTLDLNVQRWSGSAWSGASSNATNEGNFDWNLPLYAPASGEIASCWRSFPDNPRPGVRLNLTDPRIFTGGNHVVILTDQGNAISLNHFREDTIPVALCPSNAPGFPFPLNTAREGDWRVAAYIEPGDRPRVEEGQFLGRVGNSGNSGGPHLHISFHTVTGADPNGREALSDARPLPFRNAWAKAYVADENTGSLGWWRLMGDSPFIGNSDCTGNYLQANVGLCGFKFLHSSPFLRRANAAAGPVGFVETHFLSPDRIVVGLRDGNGDLMLIVYDIDAAGRPIRRGDISAGAMSSVALSSPEPGHVLAAVRQGDGNLQMIAYRVSAEGQLTRMASELRGAATMVSAATIRDVRELEPEQRAFETLTATGFRNGEGDLELMVWDLAVAADGSVRILRRAERVAGPITAVDIAASLHFYGFYAAVRDGEGRLRVIPFVLDTDGTSIQRGDHAEAGTVGPHFAVAPLEAGVLAAMRDGDGDFRIVSWPVAASGDIGTPRSDTVTSGPVFQTLVLASPEGGSGFTTITRGEDGRVSLIGWDAEPDGRSIRRAGTSITGTAWAVSADTALRDYSEMRSRGLIATALRQDDGTLKVTTYDTNLIAD